MSKLYFEDCPRCGGDGVVHHGNVTLRVQGKEDRHCFKCLGSGKVSFKTSPEQREKNRVAAQKRRLAKWEAERDAREAKERAENGGYTICEINTMRREKIEAERKAEAAKSDWLGEVGDKIELTGECIFVQSYQSFYGYNTLYIVKTEEGSIVKFYTSSQTFDNVSKGTTVEMTGKVKAQDINADRDNQKVTVLERVKCQDCYTIREMTEQERLDDCARRMMGGA
jgi:hypothetical protein